jgi:hypothetical protein
MTKKDYVAIATAYRDSMGPIHDFYYEDFLDRIIIYLKQDNPNFNEEKFKEACGV